MPRNKQPKTLLSLTYEILTSELISTCQYLQNRTIAECPGFHILNLAKEKFRPFWIILPGQIRSELLDRCAKLIFSQVTSEVTTLGIGPGPLYLLTLLLAPDTKHLRVDLCCYYGCSHQTLLLTLLSEEGMGLESMVLTRSALLRLDCKLLQSALQSMTKLCKLKLRNISSDNVLRVIGPSCPLLQYLDVEHSKQVTDKGLRYLLLNTENLDEEQEGTNYRKNVILRCIRSMLSRIKGDGKHIKNIRNIDYAWPLDHREEVLPISKSLRILKIANTGITYAGIVAVLKYVPNLESLGEYCHLGRVLEIADKNVIANELMKNKLKYGRTSRTTQNQMNLIQQYCPLIQKLCITEPQCSPNSFSAYSNLTSLQLNSIRTDTEWIQGFYNYLSKYGPNLSNLELRFFPSDIMLAEFDVSMVINYCSNLKSLTQDGALVEWTSETKKKLYNLEKIQLGKIVSQSAVTNVIKCAPNLKMVHIYSTQEMKNKDVTILSGSNIECFYVYESKWTEEIYTLMPILMRCSHLTQLGWLRNWGIACTDVEVLRNMFSTSNLELNLTLASHWYCSDCFPIT